MKMDQHLPSDSARLFLALLPDEALRTALAAHAGNWQWPAGAARYAPADWHLTLHFIGSVPRQRIDALCPGLTVPLQPFTLRLGQPALWPHGLAVLLPQGVPVELQRLHADLGEALHGLGLRVDERPYRPHLTLARHAALAVPAPPPVLDWQVRTYALVESTGNAQQRYRVCRRFD
jgi:2'-5' RNA ligase